jgi:hypothetical protein
MATRWQLERHHIASAIGRYFVTERNCLMTQILKFNLLMALLLTIVSPVGAQDVDIDVEETPENRVESTEGTANSVADKFNSDPRAEEARAGILKPIYKLAQFFSFSAFHWIAFAVMVTGVVSFALQLTIGKLVVLTKRGFSLSEILGDALGLVVSLVGLVLTTQAATQNSHFTTSPFAVLSATALGVVVGFVFYWWGQRQELDAVVGRKAELADSERV